MKNEVSIYVSGAHVIIRILLMIHEPRVKKCRGLTVVSVANERFEENENNLFYIHLIFEKFQPKLILKLTCSLSCSSARC
jgi:hypothetical protein